MNRLTEKLSDLKNQHKKALAMFVTAGYPEENSTVELVKVLEESGADIIELGIPFSDPLADGPTIQLASQTALKNGINISSVLSLVREIRKSSNIPLVLMGYVNPIFAYGLETFIRDAAQAGVDGTIIADLPIEEANDFREMANHKNVSTIFMTAPTTPDERLKLIDEASTGFVYAISRTGVTGNHSELSCETIKYLDRCRKNITKNPMLAGFGISTKKDAQNISSHTDGIIVGSALIEILNNSEKKSRLINVNNFCSELRRSLDEKE